MITIDFVALAQQGAEAWNQWRAENPDYRPSLSRAYLYGQSLSGFDLSYVDFSRACLIGADLSGADLSGACLQSVYASDSCFCGATLFQTDLRQGSFSEADFSEADLTGAKADGSNFGGACFTGACLMGWQVDETTAFAELKGDYLYLGAEFSLRWPASGTAQAGRLARFLRRRSHPAHFKYRLSSQVLAWTRCSQQSFLRFLAWSQATTVTVWRSLRTISVRAVRESEPTTRALLQWLRLCGVRSLRYSRYGYIQGRRSLRKPLKQLRLVWAQFILG